MEINYKIKKNDPYFNIENASKCHLCVKDILNLEFKLSARLKLKLIKNSKIYLNGKPCDTRAFVKENDVITAIFDLEEDNSNIVPKKMDLDIVYEDEWLLIINKPAGIAVHPSILHYNDSISNGVKFYFDTIGLHKKIRPINRLDLNTSGLMIFAKCEYVQECLIKQMTSGLFKKEYLALAYGSFINKSGTINLPIARKSGSIIERCIDDNGQPSITHYEVLQEFTNYSLIKCNLETGRTHQIRVHMAYIGHPLIGDTLYGNDVSSAVTKNVCNLASSPVFNFFYGNVTNEELSNTNRQALHSFKLEFIHPVSKQTLTFTSALPLT